MRSVLLGVLALLALTGCRGATPVDRPARTPTAPAGELRFEWDIGLRAVVTRAGADPKRAPPPPTEGDLVPFDLTLRNDSDLPILLVNVTRPGARVPAWTWQKPLPGELRSRPAASQLIYTPGTSTAVLTEPIFNDGLLMSGESVTVRIAARCLGPTLRLQVTALVVSESDAMRVLHAAVSRRDGASSDVAAPVTFVPATPTILGQWRSESTGANTREALVSSHRTVLYRPGRLDLEHPLLLDVPLAVKTPPFGVRHAASRYGISEPLPAHTYSAALKAWVFRIPRSTLTCAVSRDAVHEWAHADLESFDLLDSAENPLRVEFSEEAAFALRDRFAIDREVSGGALHHVGWLTRAGAKDFLLELERSRLSMEAFARPSGEGALRVDSPFPAR